MAQRKDPIKTNKIPESNNGVAFVTFDPNNPEEAANAMQNAKALDLYQAVAYGGGRDRYADISTDISIRNEFSRGDYDAYRDSESRPSKSKAIMGACDKAYKKVGIVRNVIDLMSDFGCQGVRVVHENKRIQRFVQKWFTHKVDGPKVTERFLNYLYRLGTVVSQRQMCKISIAEERRLAMADTILEPTHTPEEPLKPRKRVIPCGYSFLNPLTIEIAGGELAQFAGSQAFGLKITGRLRMKITSPQNEMEKSLVDKLPKELVDAVTKGVKVLPLDNSKIASFSYKKDDWDSWASPMLESILDDLTVLEKMKLADLAALDGAISQIRVWRLGDLDKGILPTDVAIQKLADILLSNPGGGAFDLIWGPELSFEEVTTSVHNFLGSTKYEPILDNIFSGLGVPPTLTGSSRSSGATNNFISLQTLVQRLEYGRQQVAKFWQQELDLLAKAMGWTKAPSIQFDHMILKDEAAEKALLIQLLDRNLVSEELVIEMFGALPELENSRKRREQKERNSGRRVERLGPYSKDKLHELVKIGLSKGLIGPEDVGIDVENPPEESSPQNINRPGDNTDNKGVPGEGRPKNSKDDPSTVRDRSFKPRTSADMADGVGDFLNNMSLARSHQSDLSAILSPGILKHYGKKNLRSLSAEQAASFENIKFKVLCSLPKNSPINDKSVAKIVSENPSVPNDIIKCYNSLMSQHIRNVKRQPSIEETRTIQAASYALCL